MKKYLWITRLIVGFIIGWNLYPHPDWLTIIKLIVIYILITILEFIEENK